MTDRANIHPWADHDQRIGLLVQLYDALHGPVSGSAVVAAATAKTVLSIDNVTADDERFRQLLVELQTKVGEADVLAALWVREPIGDDFLRLRAWVGTHPNDIEIIEEDR